MADCAWRRPRIDRRLNVMLTPRINQQHEQSMNSNAVSATEPRRAAKVGHKKTRTGCLKCRARRVKCDEQRPVCASCIRLGLACEYATSHSQDVSNSSSPNEGQSAPSEQSARLQRMQLKLIHAYTIRSVSSASRKNWEITPDWLNAWFIELPKLAFEHDNLLYALLSFSATQVLAMQQDEDVVFAQLEFWTRALREQRQAITTPGYHLEAAVMASYLICMTAFGMLKERELTPYTPPLDWFELAQGAQNVCPDMEDLPDDTSVLVTTLKITTPLWKKHSTIDDFHRPILDHRLAEEAGEDECTAQAYERALAVIGQFRKSVRALEPPHMHVRWTSAFPQILSPRFVALLREQRPRALAVILCFWAVLMQVDLAVLKAFGDADGSMPRRELTAALAELSPEWHDVLAGVLAEVELPA